MTVRFIHRTQVLQVIEGENGRKGELSVITCDNDIAAENVEGVVTQLAYARADKNRDNQNAGRVDSFIGRVQQGTP